MPRFSIRTLGVILGLALLSSAPAAWAQGDGVGQTQVPERVVDIDTPEAIEGSRVEPMGDLIDGTQALRAGVLIPERVSFVPEIIESTSSF
jgi:hypothetical protein